MKLGELQNKTTCENLHNKNVNNNFEQQRPGSIIPFGGYDWLVLEVQNGKALLLSKYVLEKREYNNQHADITWENCTLRSYLNGDFFNTFSANDKKRIVKTKVINNDNPWYDPNDSRAKIDRTFLAKSVMISNDNPWYDPKGGSATIDRIFLLNIWKVVKYFGDNGQLKNRPKDTWHIDDQYSSERIATEKNGKPSWWWLRTPGGRSHLAAAVSDDGCLFVGGLYVNDNRGGVRPALWLNLES